MALPPAPWDNQIFNFGWNPYSLELVACDHVAFAWGDNFNASPNSTGPYTLTVYSGFAQPLSFNVGTGNSVSWLANIPPGNSYMFGMTDAHGFSGGISQIVQLDSPLNACDIEQFQPNTLEYELLSPTSSQCGLLQLLVKNGAPPYQLQVIVENHQPKTLNFTSELLIYAVALTDSTGKSSMEGLNTVVPSSNSSCINAAATATVGYAPQATYSLPLSATNTAGTKHKNAGAIAGGVVGGVAFVFLIFLLVFFLFPRIKQRLQLDQPRRQGVRELDLEEVREMDNRIISPTAIHAPYTPWSHSHAQNTTVTPVSFGQAYTADAQGPSGGILLQTPMARGKGAAIARPQQSAFDQNTSTWDTPDASTVARGGATSSTSGTRPSTPHFNSSSSAAPLLEDRIAEERHEDGEGDQAVEPLPLYYAEPGASPRGIEERSQDSHIQQ
ncbi:hypothetical protein SISNIDRAFT_462029 [Sistotremastrum niveocremeum HHB9708]|uniref:Uncharacterized protein n=1 Tax=Sistotremastrum niveocremeum HHB9708 TaxID=1314777 RepID=A0A165AKC2_9AGAM|nr:hypothetical protein SISNIDRAFT_462029 [Sistotremastrum niveocremeum HHB9708]